VTRCSVSSAIGPGCAGMMRIGVIDNVALECYPTTLWGVDARSSVGPGS
jgi:hypothetical protein